MIYAVASGKRLEFEGCNINSFIIFTPRGGRIEALSQYAGLYGRLANGEWFTAYHSMRNLDVLVEDGTLRRIDDPRAELKYRLKFTSSTL